MLYIKNCVQIKEINDFNKKRKISTYANYILKFIPIVQDSGDTNDTKKTFLRFSARQITRSGVRTHADNRPLELKSNALTTRPSW